jgi:hypothetical protein
MQYKVLIAALLLVVVARADEPLEPPPSPWEPMPLGGPNQLAGRCDIGIDGELAAAGEPNLAILCENDMPSFGGLTQAFDAAPYWGKRVRFSAWLQGAGIETIDGVGEGGGLFITVGSPNGFIANRMQERALSGFTSWVYRDFVVDVPEGAPRIAIGIWLEGKGKLWARDLVFETVPIDVPANLSWDQDPALAPRLSLE